MCASSIKFYIEAPTLTSMSGVTGSDLKKRIFRIMAEQAVRKLDLRRKLMLGLATGLAITVSVVLRLMQTSEVHAQTAAQKMGIDDTWQGTLHTAQKDLQPGLKVSKTDKGALKATIYSIDQSGGQGIQVTTASFEKLLADRLQLKFHQDKKELSAHMLVVSKNGPKIDKSDGDPSGLPGLFFRQLGVLTVRNATMTDFTQLMQSAMLDRPVVDQTSLEGKRNFLLKWAPDESQFSGMGMKVLPPSAAADAPPPLFTAIQEQIELKLDAAKTPVKVLVLDHVENPSEN
jgi:uncharacterized protein (TIGR03435 family)